MDKEFYKNFKGFIYSDKTPQRDKELYYAGIKEAEQLYQAGQKFLRENQMAAYQEATVHHEEYAVQCKYIHRGYYCPSPVVELIVGRIKRGKLLKRRTARSRIAYRYVFCDSKRIHYVERFCENGTRIPEYLVYDGDCVYGFTVEDGKLTEITKEIYENGRIVRFLYLLPFVRENKFEIMEFRQECYFYDDLGIAECELITIMEEFIANRRYRFGRCDGYLVDYVETDSDGRPIPGSPVYTPGIKRRADPRRLFEE